MAFPDEATVQNFVRAGAADPSFSFSSFILPIDDRSKYILSSLIKSLLWPEYKYRPTTDDILALLDCLDSTQTSTEVWLSGCEHTMRHHGQDLMAIAGMFPATVAGRLSNYIRLT